MRNQLAFVFFLGGLVSCSKTAISTDTLKPTIELIYPKNLPTLVPGSPLCVKSVITDNNQLSAVTWKISDKKTNTILYREDFEPSGRNFVLDKTITLPSSWRGSHIAAISASDLCGNMVSIQFSFEVNQ